MLFHRYEGIRPMYLTLREGVAVRSMSGKNRYVTLEWPLYRFISMTFT